MEEAEIKRVVGQQIKKYRNLIGLSQTALGKMVELQQRQIVRIEKGESFPQLSTLVKLAKIFNCNIDDFYRDMPFKDKNNAISEIVDILQGCNLSQLADIYSISKIVRNNLTCV